MSLQLLIMSPFSSSSPLETDAITRELDAGERIVWNGRPDPARLKQKAVPQALLAIPLTAFLLFWIWGASEPARADFAAGKPLDFESVLIPVFGVFGLILVALIGLNPWLEGAKARRTFYALTERRALVVVEGRRREIKSVLPAQLQIERVELPGGRGDIVLRRQIGGRGQGETAEEIGFYGIENAREVERLARELASRTR